MQDLILKVINERENYLMSHNKKNKGKHNIRADSKSCKHKWNTGNVKVT